MRTVRIMRAKRMEAAANKLQVEVDGKAEGKLGNGKELTVELDDAGHELYLHGGVLQGKGFSCKLHIPQGGYSYTFQIDMMDAGNSGYKPVLRPTDGQRLKDQIRAISLIGTNSTIVLMDEKVRAALRAPESFVQLVLTENSWFLGMSDGVSNVKLFEQNYASSTGGIMAAINTAAQKAAVSDHAQAIDTVFSQYFRFLPDYEIIGVGRLRFRG